jgi:hypothetical protein
VDLFDLLLQDFSLLLHRATVLVENDPQYEIHIALARLGFMRFERGEVWENVHQEFIRALRAGDYSDEALHWYEEAAPCIAKFACLAWGALLGLHASNHLSESEMLQMAVWLPGFLSLNNEVLAVSCV